MSRPQPVESAVSLRPSPDRGPLLQIHQDTLARLRKTIIDMVGPQRARAIYSRSGFSCGFADAVRLRDLVPWSSVEAWLRAACDLLEESGLARPVIDELHLEGSPQTFRCTIHWENSCEVAMHRHHFSPSSDPVCWELTGYLSGCASACLGSEIRFLENTCCATGAERCQAEGRHRRAWDPFALRLLEDFDQEDLDAELTGVYDELMRINEQLTDLTQSATDAIVAANSRGQIKMFNRAAERMFGYKTHAVLGRPLSVLMPGDVAATYRQAFDEFLATSHSNLIGHPHETQARRINGRLFPIELTISASNLQREPLFTLIARDITERRQLEAERREKAINLEATLNSTSDGVLLVTYTPEGEIITLANRRLAELLSIDSEELLGHAAGDLAQILAKRVRDPDDYLRLVGRIYAEKDLCRRDTLEIVEPRALFIERTTGPVRTPEGEIIGRIWSYRDITLQREAELRVHGYTEELEKTVAERTSELKRALLDLTKADELKSRFISNVSHEFRTPLTSVRGFTETILLNRDMDEETMVSFLKIIQDETDRLNHLIEDLLDMSRIEVGRLELAFSPTRVSVLAHQVASAMQPMVDDKKLMLEVQAAPDEPIIAADPDRLYRVLLNLVSNAIKFTSQGGKITMAVDTVPEARSIEIRVSDTGIGVPQDQLSRIFDRFEQVERAGHPNVGGTGLGLAIVSSLVEAHHGEISVESEEGLGTTFMIRLPVRQPAAPVES